MFDWQTFNENIISQLKKTIEEKFGPEFIVDLDFSLEPPPESSIGDLGWPTFSLAEKFLLRTKIKAITPAKKTTTDNSNRGFDE